MVVKNGCKKGLERVFKDNKLGAGSAIRINVDFQGLLAAVFYFFVCYVRIAYPARVVFIRCLPIDVPGWYRLAVRSSWFEFITHFSLAKVPQTTNS